MVFKDRIPAYIRGYKHKIPVVAATETSPDDFTAVEVKLRIDHQEYPTFTIRPVPGWERTPAKSIVFEFVGYDPETGHCDGFEEGNKEGIRDERHNYMMRPDFSKTIGVLCVGWWARHVHAEYKPTNPKKLARRS